MEIVETLLGISCIILWVLTTKSDWENGVIYNKILKVFAIIALALDIIYYVAFAKQEIVDFLINILIMMIISVVLFYTHSFAGGDCKLAIVFSILYPARLYFFFGQTRITLFFAIAFSIFYGYLYLLVTSISGLIKKKTQISINYFKMYFWNFGKSFVIAMIYISAINLIAMFIMMQGVKVYIWIMRVLCISTAWVVGRKKFFRKWYIIGIVLCIDVIFACKLKIIPISINPENYILVILLLLCQMTMKTGLYETISIAQLKQGMILSLGSSTLFQNSRVRGLPNISTEDLRDRLTSEEVDSVKRWANGREVKEITIVKKIPFAIFLGLGFLTYFIIWSAIS